MKDLAEQITDALLDLRSEAIARRATGSLSCAWCGTLITQAHGAVYVDETDGDCCWGDDNGNNENGVHEPLTVWTVARLVPSSFEAAGVRPLPNGTGDIARPCPDQCSRVSELVRQAREWNGKARAGYSNVVGYRKMRQSKARRMLGRAA